MLCWILIVGGLLIMMGQHDRSEALFYYFRLEDQVPETHLLRLHEKAGRSQDDSFLFFIRRAFIFAEEPLSPCFHSHSRGAIDSLGAGWAFSVQPVLPSVWRPLVLLS